MVDFKALRLEHEAQMKLKEALDETDKDIRDAKIGIFTEKLIESAKLKTLETIKWKEAEKEEKRYNCAKKTIVIICKPLQNQFIAYKEGSPEIYRTGVSKENAIGSLMYDMKRELGIEIKKE